MTVWICENNLLWSVRLANNVRALGHEALVISTPSIPQGPVDVAILNLTVPELSSPAWIADLRAKGAYVIGHAGHKEKDSLAAGAEHGCDRVVTNGKLANRLDAVLASVKLPDQPV